MSLDDGHNVRDGTAREFGNPLPVDGTVVDGHWFGVDMLINHFGALSKPEEIAGKTIAEVWAEARPDSQ